MDKQGLEFAFEEMCHPAPEAKAAKKVYRWLRFYIQLGAEDSRGNWRPLLVCVTGKQQRWAQRVQRYDENGASVFHQKDTTVRELRAHIFQQQSFALKVVLHKKGCVASAAKSALPRTHVGNRFQTPGKASGDHFTVFTGFFEFQSLSVLVHLRCDRVRSEQPIADTTMQAGVLFSWRRSVRASTVVLAGTSMTPTEVLPLRDTFSTSNLTISTITPLCGQSVHEFNRGHKRGIHTPR